jgi:hypothetical protein
MMETFMTFALSSNWHAEGARLRRAPEDLDHEDCEGAKHEGCEARGTVPICHAEGAVLFAPEVSEVQAFQILRRYAAQDDNSPSDAERLGWGSYAERGNQ